MRRFTITLVFPMAGDLRCRAEDVCFWPDSDVIAALYAFEPQSDLRLFGDLEGILHFNAKVPCNTSLRFQR